VIEIDSLMHVAQQVVICNVVAVEIVRKILETVGGSNKCALWKMPMMM
jgi:hypothetical protein